MQDRPLISFDYAAKTVLRNPSNFGILSGFLSELLCKDVVVQEILESESLKDNDVEGLNRVDMKVKINDAEIVVVEIQFEHEADFLCKNNPNPKPKTPNPTNKSAATIDIVYFNLSQGLDYIYSGRTNYIGMHTKEELKLAEDKKKHYGTTNIGDIYPEYYLIEVNKFDETIRSNFDEWIYFLKTDQVKSDFSAKGLGEAKEKLDYLKLSLEEQVEYDRKMDKRSSFKSAMDTAKFDGHAKGKAEGLAEGELIGEARGIEKGKAEGIAEAILQTAKKMKAEGMELDIISKITGLSAKTLNSL